MRRGLPGHRGEPLRCARVGGSGRFERVLSQDQREDNRAAAAVAALCFFVEVSLAAPPEDEPIFSPVDDAMSGRMFG
ncbi:hypothetical protein [Nannocystis pusilla]|uniref:hypothetical protein n=1 Tax=Nannocystis pusilla TaxID=889268 RepID=UPI003DA3FF0C